MIETLAPYVRQYDSNTPRKSNSQLCSVVQCESVWCRVGIILTRFALQVLDTSCWRCKQSEQSPDNHTYGACQIDMYNMPVKAHHAGGSLVKFGLVGYLVIGEYSSYTISMQSNPQGKHSSSQVMSGPKQLPLFLYYSFLCSKESP